MTTIFPTNVRHRLDLAIDLIKEFEGVYLTAYQDSVGVWTIGWGHTGSIARPGVRINRAAAEMLLADDIRIAAAAVQRYVTVELRENQFNALVSFVFNLGADAFRKSTLLKKVNARDFDGAAEEFGRWIYAGKKKLPGLIRRRAAERKLFVSV